VSEDEDEDESKLAFSTTRRTVQSSAFSLFLEPVRAAYESKSTYLQDRVYEEGLLTAVCALGEVSGQHSYFSRGAETGEGRTQAISTSVPIGNAATACTSRRSARELERSGS